MKTLLLMRHAKSDWEADFGSDHDRPLNERGVRSARIMGRVLRAEGIIPDLVISSSALRAKATAELAIEAGDWGAPLRLERALYESGPQGVLEAVASIAPVVGKLMIVGHQPTWSMLVSRLTGAGADMTTGSVAEVALDFDGWAELPGASGVLARVLTPRTYFEGDFDREDG